MHSITLNQNWKIVRVTLDPPQKGPSRKCNEPIVWDQGKGSWNEVRVNVCGGTVVEELWRPILGGVFFSGGTKFWRLAYYV